MGTHIIYIATLITVATLGSGIPTAEDLVPNVIDVRSTQDANIQRLKAAGLEDLCPLMDEIYQFSDELGKSVYEQILSFVDETIPFFIEASRASTDIEHVINNIIPTYFDKYVVRVLELPKIIDEAGKVGTCFVDLQRWHEYMTRECRKKLTKQLDLQHQDIISETSGIKSLLNVIYSIVPHEEEIDNEMEDTFLAFTEEMLHTNEVMATFFNDYVDQMIESNESGSSLDELKDQSAEIFTTKKNSLEEAKEKLRDDLEMYREEFTNCTIGLRYLNEKSNFVLKLIQASEADIQRIVLNEALLVRRMFRTKIYEMNQQEELKPLNCEDHIPFNGVEEGETVVSNSKNGTHINVAISGVNEQGQAYTRILMITAVDKNREICSEKIVITETNEVTQRDYMFEYDDTLQSP